MAAAATMAIPAPLVAPQLTSSVGLLAMLEEDAPAVKAHALAKLSAVVANFWAEISESLPEIESLYEDEAFPQRQLAALLASKVYFYLGEHGDALTYALGAGALFDVDEASEFVDTLLARAIDEYCTLHAKKATSAVDIDPRLASLVERMVESSLARRSYQMVMGLALEARRLDLVERVISLCDSAPGEHEHDASTPAMLAYCANLFSTPIVSRDLRKELYVMLVKIYRAQPSRDHMGLCRCLAHLKDATAIAQLLKGLVEGSREQALMSFQVAFDLVENVTQSLLKSVLEQVAPPPAAAEAAGGDEAAAAPAEDDGTDAELKAARAKNLTNLQLILSGEVTISLHLEFLVRSNKTDSLILTNMKKSAEQRNSLCHSAIVTAHAFMSAGTTSDVFLRDNLDWLSRATNWAKFQATATLGVIHRGHVKQALQLLSPYLPQQGMSSSPFSEGGALYALGLIHANHGSAIRSYLLDALRNAGTDEVVQHGAALGVGIAMMGSEDDEIYEELKGALFNDSAVAGEAAALAMGLVMLGSASPKAIEEMLGYAHDTSHEKIIRGLAMGIALIMYGREEEADSLVATLLHDQDPILRYAAMYTIAFAYACSGSNHALRRLLHVAVSDVSDDVRRAAVTAIGFVLANTPAQCPRVVKLLAESYNPHVRYGCAMAVGISSAGNATRNKEALELLAPLQSDPVDYVRQGALLATSMVLMQNSDHREESALSKHRRELAKVVGDKHEDTITKFGAILATGLLDAGGRNVTISLLSKTSHKLMMSIVGMGIFSHFWFWHPLSLFASLAFTPTAAIGLNQNLQMPLWRFRSNAPPSTFAYPPPTSNEKKGEVVSAPVAVLSTSAKAGKAKAKEAKAEPTAAELAKLEEDKKAKEREREQARDAMLATLAELRKHGSVPKALYAQLCASSEAMDTSDESKGKKEVKKEVKKEGEKDHMDAESTDEKPKPDMSALVEALQGAHASGEISTACLVTVLRHRPKADEAEPEPEFEIFENPSRMLRAQEKHFSLLPGSRYVPVLKGRHSGIIMLTDQTPDETEELLPASAIATAAGGANPDEEEPSMPSPFEFE